MEAMLSKIMPSTRFYEISYVTIYFSKFCRSYCSNHLTETGLVCTHMNAIFMLSPNMAMNLKF